MFAFLQGFSYGLFLSCLPWFLIGMYRPELAVPTPYPNRWQVFLRYWLLFPFLAIVAWLTSLWGGFGPSLWGWLAGLGAIAVAIPVERGWRRWRERLLLRRQRAEGARREKMQARAEREAGVTTLNPRRPPADADNVVLALCRAKQGLLDAGKPGLAGQADRLYTRYVHVLDVLDHALDRREVTWQRVRGLSEQVCLNAVDTLQAMAVLSRGVRHVDGDSLRQRLADNGLTDREREALQQRLVLLEETEQRLRGLSARNEAAITALDRAAVAITRIESSRPQASVAAGQAMRDLQQFIDRAEQYNRPERDHEQ
ncbi:MAG: cobyrinic acid a,c-diamide synthase [Ectothiorhodospiraceae bacterium]|nr:cobyrinic acid a,c-diamide synthase [Ectothiorhodospiraceae bacterium]